MIDKKRLVIGIVIVIIILIAAYYLGVLDFISLNIGSTLSGDGAGAPPPNYTPTG